MFQQSQIHLNKPNNINHVTLLQLSNLRLSYDLWLFVVVVVISSPGLAATSAAVLQWVCSLLLL